MQIYTVYYPKSSAMDTNVSASALGTVARGLKPHDLAVAVCENWDGHKYFHWEGDFLSAEALPEAASMQYCAGPAWDLHTLRLRERRYAAAKQAIGVIPPIHLTSGDLALTLSADPYGRVCAHGSPHTEADVRSAFLAAPQAWRERVIALRNLILCGETPNAA